MKDDGTCRKMSKKAKKAGWSKFDAMSDQEKLEAALSDPDAQPLSAGDMRRMRRTPQAKIIRRALNMTQEEFAAKFQIAIGTLRDWEQARYEPDGAAKAYLKVIARNPSAVIRALDGS